MMRRLLCSLFLAATAAQDEFSLVQWSVPQPDDILSPASQKARLHAAFPLAWIHVPKTGSSFGNFLVDLPGVCPGIPLDTEITDSDAGRLQLPSFGHRWDVTSPEGPCHGNILRFGDHRGIPDEAAWEQYYKNRGMIMMRKPLQRLLSAYHMRTHSWPFDIEPENVLEFAQQVQGCTVRMLTRPGMTPEDVCGGGEGGLPTQKELELALSRLEDLAFVGITDQWALSMCLGHRMFGGACRLSDFIDTRMTRGQNQSTPSWDVEVRMTTVPWDTADLQGFEDPYDGRLFQAAKTIFNGELEQYGASLESCQSCFKEAGVTVQS